MIKKCGVGFVLLIGGLLWMAGCEHPPVKPTDDSKRIHQIDTFLESLRLAYEGRNVQSFSAWYPQNRQVDLPVITSLLDAMDHPQLDFLIDRIVLEGETVRVSLHWELRWRSQNARPVKQRGNTLFHLTGKSELRLQTIEGDNPFTAPGLLKASQP